MFRFYRIYDIQSEDADPPNPEVCFNDDASDGESRVDNDVNYKPEKRKPR